jgi:phospholipase/lecithinase/hemolysin
MIGRFVALNQKDLKYQEKQSNYSRVLIAIGGIFMNRTRLSSITCLALTRLRLFRLRLHQAVLFVALILSHSLAYAYSDLVIFGDSLSDTGNASILLGGNLPYPYYENRISNGPVAVDVLAEAFGLSAASSGILFIRGDGHNYAISGANAAGNDLHDLDSQLQTFLTTTAGQLDAKALYVIMIGGNDVRDASVMASDAQASAAVSAAVASIQLALETLMRKGAKNILVANVPDISKIPETAERAQTHPGLLARAGELSRAFNQRLKQGVGTLNTTADTKILMFDFYASFHNILNRARTHGISNTRDACFNYDDYVLNPGCDFESYIFFDSIHPTAKVHELLGRDMVRLVRKSSFLPAIMFLLRE